MSERGLYGQSFKNLEAMVVENERALEEVFGVSLPKVDPLPGCVVAQYRKIAGKTYGPYYFRVWRESDGRQRKTYVRAEDVEAVRAACRAYRTRKKWKGQRHQRALRRWGRDYQKMIGTLCRFVGDDGPCCSGSTSAL